MEALDVARLVAIITAVFGVVAALRLDGTMKFLGVAATDPRGRAELRAVYGALFGAVGASAAIIHDVSAYGVLAAVWATIGVLRFASVAADSSWNTYNAGSIAFELATAAVLLATIVIA
jgi:hypothetical protein